MNKREIKPIPTSLIVGVIIVGISMLLFKFDQAISGVLVLVLGGMIIAIDVVLMPCSQLFLRERVSKKDLLKYQGFASYYLKNRRLSYSKNTFRRAINNHWIDVVTMCLLMGVRQAFEISEVEEILFKILKEDEKEIYSVLLRGGFGGNFIVKETQEHFLYETLKQEDPFYLEELLKYKVNVDVMNSEKTTPLFRAIQQGLTAHAKILIARGASLDILNEEHLTPLFYALAEGRVEICGAILEKVQKKEKVKPIAFEKLTGPLILNPKAIPHREDQLLIKLIASQDGKTIEVVKDYFKNKKDYFMEVETGVELYTRLSHIEATMEKEKIVEAEVREMYQEEECKKELYYHIMKNYKFSRGEGFQVEGIYKTPKYIDSHKEDCPNCHGNGKIACHVCEGKGSVKCQDCEGTGLQVCSKCDGTLMVSCEKIKKYIECNNCHDGAFTCVKCDDKGKQECPECQGHGTEKCKCPADKKKKCPHCNKGYVKVKGDIYKKCPHCHEGEICMMCHNTGWVLEIYKRDGHICKRCKGSKKVTCTVCKGSKKVHCTKRYQTPCDCKDGKEVCKTCGGEKIVDCKACQGTGKEGCEQCKGSGYFYTNVKVDFKAHNKVREEKIVGNGEVALLAELAPSLSEKIMEGYPYVSTVYTLYKIELQDFELDIRPKDIEKQVMDIIGTKEQKGILNILEIAPLYYTVISFKARKGKKVRCVLINDRFYKTL